MLQMLADKGVDPGVRPAPVGRDVRGPPHGGPTVHRGGNGVPPPAKHAARTNPDLMVTRKDFVTLESLPPLIRLANRVGVLFHGEDPILNPTSY